MLIGRIGRIGPIGPIGSIGHIGYIGYMGYMGHMGHMGHMGQCIEIRASMSGCLVLDCFGFQLDFRVSDFGLISDLLPLLPTLHPPYGRVGSEALRASGEGNAAESGGYQEISVRTRAVNRWICLEKMYRLCRLFPLSGLYDRYRLARFCVGQQVGGR